jgi:hypothetical protein
MLVAEYGGKMQVASLPIPTNTAIRVPSPPVSVQSPGQRTLRSHSQPAACLTRAVKSSGGKRGSDEVTWSASEPVALAASEETSCGNVAGGFGMPSWSGSLRLAAAFPAPVVVLVVL